MNIALFASGNGSNVQVILDNVKAGKLAVTVACLVCDQAGAYVIERAKKAGLPVLIASPRDFDTRDDWERHIIAFLGQHQVDFLVLAGFMRILKTKLLRSYPNRIINIHPSLLPAFPGKDGIRDAFEAGVLETGVTVHFVDEGIDTGKIIAQERIEIRPEWNLAELEEAVHSVEYRLYSRVIQEIQNDLTGKEGTHVS